MKRISLLTLSVAAMLAAGCSSHFQLPWEKDALDPGRIATRAPLEIPPDLDSLPPPVQAGQALGASQRAGQGENANSILFGPARGAQPAAKPIARPVATEQDAPSADHQPLPSWAVNPSTPSEKKQVMDDSPVPAGSQRQKGNANAPSPW